MRLSRRCVGIWSVGALVLLCVPSAQADVSLPALFGDGAVLQRDTPLPVWGKAAPGEVVTATMNGAKQSTIAGADGKWRVTLPPLPVGGPYTLTVSGNNTLTRTGLLSGDVYVCSGQSNMELSLQRAKTGAAAVAASADPKLHLFKIGYAYPTTPADDVKASWRAASPESTGGFSAVAYFFGRAIRKAEGDVPVGLIGAYVGGTPGQGWTREEALTADPDLKRRYVDTYPAEQAAHDKAMADYTVALAKAKAEGNKEPLKPYGFWRYSSLYNGMIAPIVGFPIKGVVWYQAESNARDPAGYRTLLPTMIRDWRAQWKSSTLPFLLVQLPPFGTSAGDGLAWAEIRETQARTAAILPNVAFVVTTDIGTQHDIHPTDKEPVGERLALAARKLIYGESSLVASGPTFRSLKITGNEALVTFENAGEGLEARSGLSSGNPVSADTLSGFTIAGADGRFVPAVAKIVGKDRVSVSSPDVPAPKSVRYGFVNFPIVNLWNRNGLPAAPFRTDSP